MKAYKYRIYPNKSQEEIFAMHFGHVRHVYNWALDTKQKSYQEGIKLSKRQIQDLLVASKKQEKVWLQDINSQSLLASLENLDKAYKNYFAKRADKPKFKKKNSKQSFACPQHCRVDSKKGLLTIPKVKDIKIKLHRQLPNFKTVTITKNPSGKYYASFTIEDKESNDKQSTKDIKQSILGIDLGIEHFAILSTGQKISNPRTLDKSLYKLNKLQKIFARQTYTNQAISYIDKNNQVIQKNKKIYSKNKEKQKQKIAIQHEKIANQRHDFLHKVTNTISKSQAEYIALEDLHIKGMIKNKRLARHISNVAWHKFKVLLEYKLKDKHKKLITIDRWLPSSKTCNRCNYKLAKLPLSIRSWQCPKCHNFHDRDINASINIANFAQLQLADELGLSSVVKGSSTSTLISVSEVAKDIGNHCLYRSQEAPPKVEQNIFCEI